MARASLEELLADYRDLPDDIDAVSVVVREGNGTETSGDATIRSLKGDEHAIEASALPIRAAEGTSGAMVFFWLLEGAGR